MRKAKTKKKTSIAWSKDEVKLLIETISKQDGRTNSRADWQASTGDKNENSLIGAKEEIQIVTLECNTRCCK